MRDSGNEVADLAGFDSVPLASRIEIWRCWFLWRKEKRKTQRKKPLDSLEQGDNQQQTQPLTCVKNSLISLSLTQVQVRE